MKYCNDGQWKLNFNQKKDEKYEHFAHIIIETLDENQKKNSDHIIIELSKPTVKEIDIKKKCELISKNLDNIKKTIETTLLNKDKKYTKYLDAMKSKD